MSTMKQKQADDLTETTEPLHDSGDFAILQAVQERASIAVAQQQQQRTDAVRAVDPVILREQKTQKNQLNNATDEEERRTSGDFAILQVVQERASSAAKDLAQPVKRKQAEYLTESTEPLASGDFAILKVVEERASTARQDLTPGTAKSQKNLLQSDIAEEIEEKEPSRTSKAYSLAPSLQRSSATKECAPPGAYAAGPGGCVSRADSLRFSLVGVPCTGLKSTDFTADEIKSKGSSRLIGLPRSNGSCQTVHANPVSDMTLMEAQPVEVFEEEETENTTCKQRPSFLQILAICILLLVPVAFIVLLSVVLSQRGTTKEDNTPMPSSAPSSLPNRVSTWEIIPDEVTSAAPTMFVDLPAYTLETIDKDSMSPQFKALGWLQDQYNSPQQLDESRKQQLFAMATFFYAMEGEEHWPTQVSNDWLLDNRLECYWYSSEHGYFFENGTYVGDYYKGGGEGGSSPDTTCCNEENELRKLSLYGLDFSYLVHPHIPPELGGLLPRLRKLDLNSNRIQANLSEFLPPESLQQLTGLTYLDLSSNALTGSIPSQLGLLTHLTHLDLRQNDLDGSIPDEVQQLTSFQNFGL